MKADRIGALIVSGLLALGLAACGGGGSGGSSEETAAATGKTTTSASAEKPAASGGLTPPGTTLKLGETATLAWVPPSEYNVEGGQEGEKLKITVDSIEEGSISDFDGVELEPDEKNSTPYYLHVKIESLGDIPSTVTDDPDISITGVDDRGQEQASITFLGEFPTCEDNEPPSPFNSGESYESCLTYLIPGGGSIQKAEWNDGPSAKNEVTPYFDNPVLWSASGS